VKRKNKRRSVHETRLRRSANNARFGLSLQSVGTCGPCRFSLRIRRMNARNHVGRRYYYHHRVLLLVTCATTHNRTQTLRRGSRERGFIAAALKCPISVRAGLCSVYVRADNLRTVSRSARADWRRRCLRSSVQTAFFRLRVLRDRACLRAGNDYEHVFGIQTRGRPTDRFARILPDTASTDENTRPDGRRRNRFAPAPLYDVVLPTRDARVREKIGGSIETRWYSFRIRRRLQSTPSNTHAETYGGRSPVLYFPLYEHASSPCRDRQSRATRDCGLRYQTERVAHPNPSAGGLRQKRPNRLVRR